jgi:DNA-binding PadR family transcriptional regulator
MAVSVTPIHGYGIGQWLHANSGGDLEVEEGALYHALHRLHRRGYVEAGWRMTHTGRKATFYTLTDTGTEHLAAEEQRWMRYSGLVERLGIAAKAD